MTGLPQQPRATRSVSADSLSADPDNAASKSQAQVRRFCERDAVGDVASFYAVALTLTALAVDPYLLSRYGNDSPENGPHLG
jgi:hypothetical protein